MLPILLCIQNQHDPWIVALAALVCVMSALGATMLCRQIQWATQQARIGWLMTAGIVTGLGIWATHFIAMLGYDPGVIIGFDMLLTIGSLGIVVISTIAAMAVAMHRQNHWHSFSGALIMGGGIAGMHYAGMTALEMPAVILWDPAYVLASMVLVVLPLIIALPLALHRRSSATGLTAVLLITTAVVSLHFTGMTAISIIPSRAEVLNEALFTPATLSILVFAALLCVLALSGIAAIAARRTHRAVRDKDRQFTTLVNGITDYAIYMLDTSGKVTHWNSGAEQMLGYNAEDVLGRHVGTFFSPDHVAPDDVKQALAAATLGGHFAGESWQQRRNGSHFWAHSTLEKISDETGEHIGFAQITRDMTRIKEDQDKIEQARLHLDTALENMHQGLCLFGPDGRLILHNQRFLSMWQLSAEAIQPGMLLDDVARASMIARSGTDDVADRIIKMRDDLATALAQPDSPATVSEFGDDFVVSIATTRLGDGGWVSTFEDITHQRKSEARIAHMAMHDGLTGLANRSSFNASVDSSIEQAARNNARFGLAVIDMDGFKDINDTYGHAAGDDALKLIASRFKQVLKETETIARLGGDEFAAIMPFDDDRDLAEFVDRLNACFDLPWQPSENDFLLKASIGVAIYPDDGRTREQLCNNADLAMYRAKASLEERICYYEKGMDESARYRRQIAGELRSAIDRNEFYVLYQPQRSLKTQMLIGYEVLLRWQHPVRGLVSPAEFIPIAEETGEIFRIGEWVLREACAEAAKWDNELVIAVNISAVQLSQPNLPEILAQVLLETGLPARRLEIEITETAIIGDKARALHVLRRIKAMGIAIAIDDFGTGYSSLDTLNSFAFDKIKIDKSFLLLSHDRPQARAIIRAVLALGRSLDVPVLAEGVESNAHVDLLEAEGCEQVQGYLFGRPGAAPSLATLAIASSGG
ncbi:EAL domain-containing protein [Altererythrobacter xixiisoli]|uniref:EAL domain-containing protein n=1 Tax=Croceibacterium xixiisoli TaxID=1476466 RepID=A0A6I4TVG2_9SPHN|nr:EAL domain-containing protein [Croceibacterium xixiisoli]MXO99944.1 EAL domain-containing protein [Croceibacterium xixiisoli]